MVNSIKTKQKFLTVRQITKERVISLTDSGYDKVKKKITQNIIDFVKKCYKSDYKSKDKYGQFLYVDIDPDLYKPDGGFDKYNFDLDVKDFKKGDLDIEIIDTSIDTYKYPSEETKRETSTSYDDTWDFQLELDDSDLEDIFNDVHTYFVIKDYGRVEVGNDYDDSGISDGFDDFYVVFNRDKDEDNEYDDEDE